MLTLTDLCELKIRCSSITNYNSFSQFRTMKPGYDSKSNKMMSISKCTNQSKI